MELNHDSGAIIGIALVQSQQKISKHSNRIHIYRYMVKNIEKHTFIEKVIVSPYVCGLCRNHADQYKGLGLRIMLDVFDHYQKKGTDYIYLVVNSEKKHITPDSNDQEVLENVINNQKLTEYYAKQGFEIMPNHYYQSNDRLSGKCMYETVMRKSL